MKYGWKEIAGQIDQFKDSEKLVFKIHETFGGGFAIISANPKYPEKGQKKFLLKTGKGIPLAEQATPFWTSDKSKDLARWVTDRLGELVS